MDRRTGDAKGEESHQSPDAKRQKISSTGSSAEKLIYDEHLPHSIIISRLSEGKLVQGSLSVSPFNSMEAEVSVEALQDSVLIIGREMINRATDGDMYSRHCFLLLVVSKSSLVLIADNQMRIVWQSGCRGIPQVRVETCWAADCRSSSSG